MSSSRSSDRGHRSLPHTADLRLLAWAPTRDECVAEAVTALAASFADTRGRAAEWHLAVDLPTGTDQEVLLAALDAVIFTLDTAGAVPVTAGIDYPAAGPPTLELGLVSLAHVRLVGPAPKAATLNELRFDHHAAGCSAEVTIDV